MMLVELSVKSLAGLAVGVQLEWWVEQVLWVLSGQVVDSARATFMDGRSR